MSGNARNVGGIRSRSGRRPVPEPEHYITARQAAEIARACKQKDLKRGVIRRWNDRNLTEEEKQVVEKRRAFHARSNKKPRARTKRPKP